MAIFFILKGFAPPPPPPSYKNYMANTGSIQTMSLLVYGPSWKAVAMLSLGAIVCVGDIVGGTSCRMYK